MSVIRLPILVDSRESKVIPFPTHLVCMDHSHPDPCEMATKTYQLFVVKKQLPAADYWLGVPDTAPETVKAYAAEHGAFSSCVIERKLSADELAVNLYDRARRKNFLKALSHMSRYRFPVLLLEASPGRFNHTTHPKLPPAGLVHDGLIRVLLDYGIHFHYLPMSNMDRLKLGEWIARVLIAGITEAPPINPPPSTTKR